MVAAPYNAVWVDMGEANMRQRRGKTGSNEKAPGPSLAPVPKRDNVGAVSRYTAMLKRANAHPSQERPSECIYLSAL